MVWRKLWLMCIKYILSHGTTLFYLRFYIVEVDASFVSIGRQIVQVKELTWRPSSYFLSITYGIVLGHFKMLSSYVGRGPYGAHGIDSLFPLAQINGLIPLGFNLWTPWKRLWHSLLFLEHRHGLTLKQRRRLTTCSYFWMVFATNSYILFIVDLTLRVI